jgi:hypothetical protein
MIGLGRRRVEAFARRVGEREPVLASCRHLRLSRTLVAAFAAVAPMVAPLPALAQGKLEARYTVSISGIPIGKGNWVIDIDDTHYLAAASGVTTGLVRAFTGGQGTSVSRGTLQGGRVMSSIYASTITSSKKTSEVRITLANGSVKDSKLDPPQDADPQRVALTEEHQRGVLDPMGASLMRVAGTGDILSAEACQRTLPIFDGRMRYDLQLAFKRMDHVKADKGYAGPVVVCAVYFVPIAGYLPSRAAIRYISKLRDMEVWLAPIAGTRVLVPFRAQGPTPVGKVVLEADQFVSVASPPRASTNGAKTH